MGFFQTSQKQAWMGYIINEGGPYWKTAGTVILGWLIVSWIWHIILMIFAPATVSALAIFLICPTSLEWVLKHLGPHVKVIMTNFFKKLYMFAYNDQTC